MNSPIQITQITNGFLIAYQTVEVRDGQQGQPEKIAIFCEDYEAIVKCLKAIPCFKPSVIVRN